jgi:hypothetical protein
MAGDAVILAFVYRFRAGNFYSVDLEGLDGNQLLLAGFAGLFEEVGEVDTPVFAEEVNGRGRVLPAAL